MISTPLRSIMSSQLKGVTVLNVFFELVANSLDAGAKNICVHIRKAEKDVTAGAFVEVVDDGHGILDSDLEKVVNAMNPSDGTHKGLGRFVAAKCFGSVSYSSVATDGFRRSFEICPDSDGAFTRDDIKAERVPNDELHGTRVMTGRLSESGPSKTKTKNDFLDPVYLKDKLMDHFLLKLRDNPEIIITIKSQAADVLFEEVTLSAKDIGIFHEKESPRPLGGGHVKLLWDSRRHEGKGVVEVQAIVDGRGAKFERGVSYAVSVPTNIRIRAFVLWPGLSVNSERGTAFVDDDANHEAFEQMLKKMLRLVVQEACPNLKRQKEQVLEVIKRQYPDLSGLVTKADDFYELSDALAKARDRLNEKKDSAARLREGGGEVSLAESDDLQRRALADYVQHRQDVIITLKKLVETRSDEDVIHDLFLPRRMVVDERSALCTNMWLLDDKYMSFLSLHSDMPSGVTLDRVGLTNDDKRPAFGKKEPDLMLLYKSPSGTDGLIVELKKPFARPDENHNLSKQLVIGEATLRQALGSDAQIDMIGIATIDEETAFTLKAHNYHPMYAGRNDVYYWFNPDGKTRKYIISYDKLISDAERRNEVFLRVLQDGYLPATLPDVFDGEVDSD